MANSDEIFQKFLELPSDHRMILGILSLFPYGVEAKTVVDLFNSFDLKLNGKSVTQKELSKWLKAWSDLVKPTKITNGYSYIEDGFVFKQGLHRFAIHTLDVLGKGKNLTSIIQEKYPYVSHWSSYRQMPHLRKRDFYFAILESDQEALEKLSHEVHRRNEGLPWLEMFRPFDAALFARLPHSLSDAVFEFLLAQDSNGLIGEPGLMAFINDYNEPMSSTLLSHCIEHFIWRGDFDKARSIIKKHEAEGDDVLSACKAMLFFMEGDLTQARKLFDKTFQGTKKYHVYDTDLTIFYMLLLVITPGTRELVISFSAHFRDECMTILSDFGAFVTDPNHFKHYEYRQSGSWLNTYIACLYHLWTGRVTANEFSTHVYKFSKKARSSGYHLVASLFDDIGAACIDGVPATQRIATDLTQLHDPTNRWKLTLRALVGATQVTKQDDLNERLIWLLDMDVGVDLSPKVQKIRKNGTWSKGRAVMVDRLLETSWDRDYLTNQDKKILEGLFRYKYSYDSYEDDDVSEILPLLIGHPLIFLDSDPSQQVTFSKGKLEMSITQRKDRIQLNLNPQVNVTELGDAKYFLYETQPHQFEVFELDEKRIGLVRLLGTGLELPEKAADQIGGLIENTSSLITVHSDLEQTVETQPADQRIHLQMQDHGSGLKVSMRVRPFGDVGPYYHAGKGGLIVVGMIDGSTQRAKRDHEAELDHRAEVIRQSSVLRDLDQGYDDWEIPEVADCLEMLCEIGQIDKNLISLDWPEGKKFQVSTPGASSISIKRDKDLFSASVELRVDEQQVLDMMTLLEKLKQRKGRFLPMGEGQYLALTHRFQQELSNLMAFTEQREGQLTFHPVVAPVIESCLEELGQAQADEHWDRHLKQLEAGRKLEIELPSTFCGELRGYQMDGFRWLCRLAWWNFGACLADDMGLGKTIQTLACMLSRASQGPTLVVAPTSVCHNWVDEAIRFTPTLRPKIFAAVDRAQCIADLAPFDLVITSYTLLHSQEELLCQPQWQTVVLDEAQAIKNPATRRSKAAMKLNAAFKIITTGTPIENHLGELWNLFRFLNPGLLGSHEKFNKKFATPIEKHGEHNARNQLKKLIQPFILRRLKSDVLTELPPRTEIVLHVDQSDREKTLYESLRMQALQRLTDEDGTPGHIQILAEITRLRRACCHPSLVDSELEIEGSKLLMFREVIEELLANRHKVLVFSQFVDHLSLLRKDLEAKGISYAYLDGQTPMKKRKQQVDGFQAGTHGDVFLISLKAGGSGLNLTAADYVIHMDPWWNPAVEDQASDRAHRMGQKRPVTVYRLVTTETIEEKILDLHKHKRGLAEDLLAGSEHSGSLSAEQLLTLIKEH